MININPVVDPSAAVTDPSNPNFKPSSKTELIVALKSLVDQLPDENIPDIYDSIKGSMLPKEDEDDKGKKQMNRDTKSEQLVRLAVRKILSEISASQRRAEKAAKLWAQRPSGEEAVTLATKTRKGPDGKEIPGLEIKRLLSAEELSSFDPASPVSPSPETISALEKVSDDPAVMAFFEKMQKRRGEIKKIQDEFKKLDYLDDPETTEEDKKRKYQQGDTTLKEMGLELGVGPSGVISIENRALQKFALRFVFLEDATALYDKVRNDYVNFLLQSVKNKEQKQSIIADITKYPSLIDDSEDFKAEVEAAFGPFDKEKQKELKSRGKTVVDALLDRFGRLSS
jgi:hypothetical protein